MTHHKINSPRKNITSQNITDIHRHPQATLTQHSLTHSHTHAYTHTDRHTGNLSVHESFETERSNKIVLKCMPIEKDGSLQQS